LLLFKFNRVLNQHCYLAENGRCHSKIVESREYAVRRVLRLGLHTLEKERCQRLANEAALFGLIAAAAVKNLPSAGTNLASSISGALEKLRGLPAPQSLWILTDGQGAEGISAFSEEIKSAGVGITIVETTHGGPTALQQFCGQVAGAICEFRICFGRG
jgi:hypothetical protein